TGSGGCVPVVGCARRGRRGRGGFGGAEKRCSRGEGCPAGPGPPVLWVGGGAASPRQYSAALSVEMIFGRSPAAVSRSRSPPVVPVRGSDVTTSANGNT